MNLYTSLKQLENCIIDIETLFIQINNYNSNANAASAGSAAAYFLTNDSKNKMVKSIGQFAAIGGLIYSRNQRNNANSLESIAILNIGKALNILEIECNPFIRAERDIGLIRTYLEMTLRLGASIDILLVKLINQIYWKGHLGEQNQNLLMHLHQINLYDYKLRFNTTVNHIDRKININNPSTKFINLVNNIKISKLKKEGLVTRIIILSLIIIGIILESEYDRGKYFIIIGFCFFAFNQFFPFLPETKKLKKAVESFNNEIKATIGIKKLTLQ